MDQSLPLSFLECHCFKQYDSYSSSRVLEVFKSFFSFKRGDLDIKSGHDFFTTCYALSTFPLLLIRGALFVHVVRIIILTICFLLVVKESRTAQNEGDKDGAVDT